MESSQNSNTSPVAHALAGQLNIGSVLNRSFSMLFKNPVVFFGIVMIVAVPSFILGFMLPEGGASNAVTRVVDMVLGSAVQGSIAYGVYCVIRGRRATIGDSFSRGMARVLPLIGAALLTSIGIFVGTLLLVIPGIILMCVWAVTVPVCVIEGLGPIQSIQRSAVLTSGYRWPIFALMLLGGILSMIVVAVPTFIAGASGNVFVISIIVLIAGSLVQAFMNVMIAIIYYDLRMLKEGISIDNLAKVFD